MIKKTNTDNTKIYYNVKSNSIKTTILNNCSCIYSLTDSGSQNQGPFIFNTEVLNFYHSFSNLLKVELLGMDKTESNNFGVKPLTIKAGHLIEFKIVISNISTTETLYNLQSFVVIPKMFLQSIERSQSSVGSLTFNNVNVLDGKLNWTNIGSLAPGQTQFAIATFKALSENTMDLVANSSFSLSQGGKIIPNVTSLPLNIRIIGPLVLKKEQRIVSANGEFTEDTVDVINGEILEYRLTLTNTANQTLYNIKILDVLDDNVTFIKYSITGSSLQDNNVSWDPPLNGMPVNGTIEWHIDELDYTTGNNTRVLCFKVLVSTSKSMITNNYLNVYSLTNGKSQDQEPFVADTITDNIYNTLPYGITAELLARNESKNGNFTDNLQVDGGDIIEFKMSITNISTTITLYNVVSQIYILRNFLSYLNMQSTSIMGNLDVNSDYVNLNSSNLTPGTTAIAIFKFAAVGAGNLSFPGYINVKEKSSSEIRQFNFSKLPSISIINAPKLSSITPIISIGKAQKIAQYGTNSDFINWPINVINGDIIEFQIMITNANFTKSDNKINVYNLKIVDKLSNNLRYIEDSFKGSYVVHKDLGDYVKYNTIWGNANFNSTNAITANSKLVGGSIEWTIRVLQSFNDYPSTNAYDAILYFQCEVVG